MFNCTARGARMRVCMHWGRWGASDTIDAFGGEFQRALNALLPPTIRIVGVEETGPDF